MIRPVTQTVTGWPNGNCVKYSYSAILGIDPEKIPDLDPGASAAAGEDQGDRERAWLASIGLCLIEISVPPEQELPQEVLDCVPPVPHLISGISPRGYGHRCVGIGGRLAWDPHPSRAGLETIYSIGILVPI